MPTKKKADAPKKTTKKAVKAPKKEPKAEVVEATEAKPVAEATKEEPVVEAPKKVVNVEELVIPKTLNPELAEMLLEKVMQHSETIARQLEDIKANQKRHMEVEWTHVNRVEELKKEYASLEKDLQDAKDLIAKSEGMAAEVEAMNREAGKKEKEQVSAEKELEKKAADLDKREAKVAEKEAELAGKIASHNEAAKVLRKNQEAFAKEKKEQEKILKTLGK